MTSLHEIRNGLTCFNMTYVLKPNIWLFEKAFCQSTILDWTEEEFVQCLMPEFSEEESNKKRTEVNTHKPFINFAEAVFQDGKSFILWLFFTFVLFLLVFTYSEYMFEVLRIFLDHFSLDENGSVYTHL